MVATRCECPFIFCESSLNDWAHSRYWKRLRFTLMEFYEHSETCTDRREHALEVSNTNLAECRKISRFNHHFFLLSVPRAGAVYVETSNDGGNIPRANTWRTTLRSVPLPLPASFPGPTLYGKLGQVGECVAERRHCARGIYTWRKSFDDWWLWLFFVCVRV